MLLAAYDRRSCFHDACEYAAEVRNAKYCGYIKGKSAMQIARKFGGWQKNFAGENIGVCGYFISTVGLEGNIVRTYIRNQEKEDERYDQVKLVMGLLCR